MKSYSFKSFVLLTVSSAMVFSCSKELSYDLQVDSSILHNDEVKPVRLVSATKTSVVPASSVYNQVTEDVKSQNLFTFSLLEKDLIDLDIVTYRISYNSTVHKDGADCPTVLEGSVSFLIDNKGYVDKRYLESISLYNCSYNTSASDVVFTEPYVSFRTIHNTMIVFPFYQGGNQVNSNEGIVVAPGEFVYKGRQALDCLLAAIEFVEQLPDVSLMRGYYTDNFGLSNGGGTALAVQYLLENDDEYRQHSSTVNLHSSYVGEGHCSSASLMDNILTEFESSEEENMFGFSIDMNKLAPVGYVSTVAGSYFTWRKECFDGIDIKDYFTEEGCKLLEMYLSNQGSMVFEDFDSDCSNIFKAVNPDLYLQDSDGKYHFDKSNELVQRLYKAFEQNEVILSGWCPKTPLVFVHSTADEFLSYKYNFSLWMNLSHYGVNDNVKLETLFGLDHITSTFFLLFRDFLLRKSII